MSVAVSVPYGAASLPVTVPPDAAFFLQPFQKPTNLQFDYPLTSSWPKLFQRQNAPPSFNFASAMSFITKKHRKHISCLLACLSYCMDMRHMALCRRIWRGRRNSGVEYSLGKGEVVSSNLTGGTTHLRPQKSSIIQRFCDHFSLCINCNAPQWYTFRYTN